MKLKLDSTYLFYNSGKNISLRYEIFVDANGRLDQVAKILITQEHDSSRHMVDFFSPENLKSAGSFSGFDLQGAPLKVERASDYCTALHQQGYGADK